MFQRQLSLVTRKPVRHKPACAPKEASNRLESSDIKTRGIILSRQWTIKVLIRLRGCAGWSAPLLFAYVLNRFSHDFTPTCNCRYLVWTLDVVVQTCPVSASPYLNGHLNRLMTKPTKWHVRPAKIQISLGIRPVWSESSLSAWRKLRSLATHLVHSEDSWSDWADAQATLSLRWVHMSF